MGRKRNETGESVSGWNEAMEWNLIKEWNYRGEMV